MINKLSKKEIKEISIKFGWPFDKTKEAVLEYRDTKSIINNQDQLLRTCLLSNNSKNRLLNVVELLLDNFPKDECILIDHLFNEDPLLTAVKVFDYYEYINELGDTRFLSPVTGKDPFLIYSFITLDDREVPYSRPIATSSQKLRFDILYKKIDIEHTDRKLCDLILRKIRDERFKNNDSLYNSFINELLNLLIPKYDFKIFTVDSLRNYITRLKSTEYLPDSNEHLAKIKKLFSRLEAEAEKRSTEKGHLFNYCLVEQLRQKGVKPFIAIGEAAKLTKKNRDSFKTRYYETKSKLKSNNKLNVERIILDNNFTDEIKKQTKEVIARLNK